MPGMVRYPYNWGARESHASQSANGDRLNARSVPVLSVRLRIFIALALVLLIAGLPQPGESYSFLTHRDLIDVAWQDSIRPLLLARFPTATEEQLREARAYAYGGANIQDMGYYPFGHQFFSNLTHYVRSGDFVDNLFANASTVNEYAFAIGALSHYVGDNIGHEFATNPSTAVEFPKLRKKYGAIVTYEEDPSAHVRTEFAYDVGQLNQHQFAPVGYLRSVGFMVPQALLERAFVATYGLSLRSVLGPPLTAIKSYRSSLDTLLPRVADAEVLLHRKDLKRDADTPAYHAFDAGQDRAARASGWRQYERRPSLRSRLLAFAIWIVPKIGPLSDLAIRGPNPETERWYVESVNRSIAEYEGLLREKIRHPRGTLGLAERDLDTGSRVAPGAYRLTDRTYAQLLAKLTAQPSRPLPARLRRNILAYYADPNAPITTKKDARAWKRVQAELETLRGMRTTGEWTQAQASF